MNYQGTPYQEAMTQGMFDDWICALLQKQLGQWRVVTYAIGATDVPYTDWSSSTMRRREFLTELVVYPKCAANSNRLTTRYEQPFTT